jgi:hypothetical protein
LGTPRDVHPLHHRDRRQQLAELVGELGVPLRVLRDVRPLAATAAQRELFGDQVDGVTVGSGGDIKHV